MHTYKNRTVAGTMTDFDLYDVAYNKGKNVLLEGPTGEGKSMSVRSWARKHNVPLYEVNFAFGVDASHVIGGWYPQDEGGFVWQDGVATKSFGEKDGAVLFLDEINRVPPAVSAHLHTILDVHRSITLADFDGEVITPSGNVLIVAAMNPASTSYQGATALDEALRRRFPYQVAWGVDNETLTDLIQDRRVVDLATALRGSTFEQQSITPLSTASFVELDEAIRDVGQEAAIEFYLNRFRQDERETVSEFVQLYLVEGADGPSPRGTRPAPRTDTTTPREHRTGRRTSKKLSL